LHGFFAAQGLHGVFAAQGLHGLHGLSDEALRAGVSTAALAEAIGGTAVPVARVATLRATKVFFNIRASKGNQADLATIYDQIMRLRAPDLGSRSRYSDQISARESNLSTETGEKADQTLGPGAE